MVQYVDLNITLPVGIASTGIIEISTTFELADSIIFIGIDNYCYLHTKVKGSCEGTNLNSNGKITISID